MFAVELPSLLDGGYRSERLVLYQWHMYITQKKQHHLKIDFAAAPFIQ